MPLYGFKCKKCDKEFDEVLAWKDKVKVRCPKCGGEVKHLPSCGSFVMDGVMASRHSNSPEGQARATETRRKHIKNHTHREFRNENREKVRRDGKWSYN